MNEIREDLRLWLGTAGLPAPGLRKIAEHAGVDRKTVRRYVEAAQAAGLARTDSAGAVSDDVIAAVRQGIYRRTEPRSPERRSDSVRLRTHLYRHRERIDDYRPALTDLLAVLLPGDSIAVCRLDRLGRNLPHLIELIADLKARGVAFASVTEQLDTTTAGGELFFHIFGALAGFERQLLRERTHAGLAAARERGKIGGRPPALTVTKKREATRMRNQGRSIGDIAEVLGVSKRTLYRHFETTTTSETRA